MTEGKKCDREEEVWLPAQGCPALMPEEVAALPLGIGTPGLPHYHRVTSE